MASIICNRCGEEHQGSLDESFARVYSCPEDPPAIILEQPDRYIGLDDEMALDLACALLAECDPAVLRRIDRHMAAAVARLLELDGVCKVKLGLMEPDPRSGGCDQPTCMRCYPEPGDRRHA